MEIHKLKLITLLSAIALVSGCGSLNPNPNIGMRTVDAAFEHGDCNRAIKYALPAAERGEPWAMYRMGVIKSSQQCPSPDEIAAFEWMEKASNFRSKSAWEKGATISNGPTGFFNARASSLRASLAIANAHYKQNIRISWVVLNRARLDYSSEEDGYTSLTKAISNIEKDVPEATLRAWTEDAIKHDWQWEHLRPNRLFPS